MKYENVDVEFDRRRWNVRIKITDRDTGEEVETFVASADSGLTYGDGIFFGTAEDYEEAIGYL